MDKDSIEKSKGNMAYVKKLLENGNLEWKYGWYQDLYSNLPSNIHRKTENIIRIYNIYIKYIIYHFI